ncbi:2-hydroxyacyl-CoA dehydratase subunit D [Kosmotoga sp. DU53]|uniref:2-hydroxyacyl-CoA dehydratase subunit D n=1 Tax=Kosmotoga sp. DU53 TaxID=1310160 RepID=UPI0007C573A9|nr:2-hydroxyacyl-CoA dehydratase family protein [Kosmotoga sp. DU53]OAA21896.1 2-hydroxyglutaryl-CoA dehydratase [Kosmotoga sp. DU53]
MSKSSRLFGKFLSNYLDQPEKFRRYLSMGLSFELFKRKNFPDKKKPSFVASINHLAVYEVYQAVRGNNSVWVNLLAPSEILIAAGLNPVSAEGIAGTMSAMHLEGYAIELSMSEGVTPSLCTFHRCSLGTAIWKSFPKPLFTMTTSVLCDGNAGTFHSIAKAYGVPFFMIDVPRGRKKEYVPYVEKQLRELITFVEEITGQTYNMNRLSEILEIEEETRKNLLQARKKLAEKVIPFEVYEHMNTLYVLHTLVGDERLLEASNRFLSDFDREWQDPEKRVLWLHIPPYYDNELFELFSPYGKVSVVSSELWWDWVYPLNPKDPIRSLAEKLVFNIENGTVEERGNFLIKLSEELKVDAVVHFSHWGCRQSSGAVGYLKKQFIEKEIPFLSLDGDCVDHTAESAGQFSTRVKAFFEMLGV